MKGAKRYKEIIFFIIINYMIFLKKKFIWNKQAILDSKKVHAHNSGSALRIFSNFVQIKGPRGTKTLNNEFVLKKILLGENRPFWAQKWHGNCINNLFWKKLCKANGSSLGLTLDLRIFFKFCTIVRTKRHMKNILFFFVAKEPVGSKIVHPHNFGICS